MRTAGQLIADTPNTDGHIFIGADELISPTLTSSALSQTGEGLLIITLPAAATTNVFKTVDAIVRSGQAPNYQQQFGTAALVPGPSGVANTSDPLGIVGFPPFTAANTPTIKGPVTGFVPKGLQLTSFDIVYQVLTLAATSVSFGATLTAFGAQGAGAVAPVVTNIVTFGTNGLPVAVAANPVTTRVAVATPIFITGLEQKIQIHLQAVTPATSTVSVFGVNINTTYNYN